MRPQSKQWGWWSKKLLGSYTMRMPWNAEARMARAGKGLSSALEGEQSLGDGIGLVTSHMFGGAVVGGDGNVALDANSGDKINGTANYGAAFMSGAIAGAVVGGGAGVYRAKGAKKFSEARIAKAGEKYEQAIDRVANQKAKGPAPILDYYGNVAPPQNVYNRARISTNAPPIVAGNPKKPKTQSYGQGGVSAGAGFNGVVPQTNLGSGVKTSTGTSAVNPVNSGAGNGTAARAKKTRKRRK
jgi:hypothetical protein